MPIGRERETIDNLIFKDVLPDHPIDEIEVRTFGPNGEDLYVGMCAWDTRDLISLDGDIYGRCWLIEDYEVTITGMTVWIKPAWGCPLDYEAM